MNKVAKFEKVSKEQFAKDWQDNCFGIYGDSEIVRQNIKLPVRATKGSAGYDFFTPVGLWIDPGDTIKIPTGIRCKIDEGWVLAIVPRSSLGFKFRLQLDNTVGIIDSDYYGAKNEGHIFIKVTNDSRNHKSVVLKAGEAFAQGIFLPFGITEDDKADAVRNGGFGSTNKE